jgi:hypothetical protein
MPPRSRLRPPPSLVAACLLGAGVLTGCVTTRTVTYLPDAAQARMSLEEGRTTLGTFLGVECTRLRGAGRAAATAPVTVLLDAEGRVTGAELDRSTGDARADGLIGAVAAQLQVAPPAGGRATLRAGYQCDDAGGVSVTLERATEPAT